MPSFTPIRRSEVPIYLQTSEFYLSLDESDKEFSVPSDCMKMDPGVHDLSNLRSILLTMRYWILKSFPSEAIEFMIISRDSSVLELLNAFDSAFPTAFPLVRKLYESNIIDACDLAAQFGRVDFLDYYTKQRGEMDKRTMVIAAENGHVDCLAYCYDFLRLPRAFDLNECDWRTFIQNGNFQCLPFLVRKGVPLMRFVDLAVQLNSAKCLKYLNEHFDLDCWTPSTMADAAGAGQVKLVKKLHEEGCPWDEFAYIAALKEDKGVCLKYLLDQRGIPTSSAFTTIEPNIRCSIALLENRMEQFEAKLSEQDKKMDMLDQWAEDRSAQLDQWNDRLDRLERRTNNLSYCEFCNLCAKIMCKLSYALCVKRKL